MKSSSSQESHHQEEGTQYLSICRKIFLFLLLSIIFATYVFYHRQAFHHRQKPFIVTVNATSTMILVWHWPFGYSTQLNPNICSETYSIPNCILVANRSWFHKADFVVFHNRELIEHSQRLPTDHPRSQHERWVWFSLESPENNGNLRPFAGYFNYTMSYKRNSDFYIPYGRLVPKAPVKGMTVGDFIPKHKSSLACWVVSNFLPRHRRTSVYNQLKNVIQVDVYGHPFNKHLSQSSLLPTISRCYFYLSFENSEFKDYITEKFWKNALLGGAVPVVLGATRADYEAVAPKGSFIHVDDFSSVEELGTFLKDLAEDKERYASYFTWHLNYSVQTGWGWEQIMCSICNMTDRLQPKQVYKDLQAWEWSR